MRKTLTIAILILFSFLLQSTLRVVIPAQYALPNLLMILTCSMGLMRGKKAGMLTGFVSGLIYDLFYGSVFGLSALLFLYIGYANGFLYKVFFDDDVRIPMAAVGLSDFCYHLIYFLVRVWRKESMHFGAYLTGRILPEVISSVLCTIFLYYLLRWINARLVLRETEAEQSPWLRR